MAIKARKFELNLERREMDREEVIQKWSGVDGIELVFPQGQQAIGQSAARLLKHLCEDPVCEIGCGTGRIAKIFKGRNYIGVDINESAIAVARENISHGTFQKIKWDDPFPDAQKYLFYTVLLHIPDDEIKGVVKRLKNRVVVAESMNRWIREYGLSNNFKRDPWEYRKVFNDYGFSSRIV